MRAVVCGGETSEETPGSAVGNWLAGDKISIGFVQLSTNSEKQKLFHSGYFSDQHDHNFAEKLVAHNLLHDFCRLTDSADF